MQPDEDKVASLVGPVLPGPDPDAMRLIQVPTHTNDGLCLDPPERAPALWVDEKSQIQAVDRSLPVLPMMPHVPGWQTADHVRHGTTTLLAALNAATGEVLGARHRQHRVREFKKFLIQLDQKVLDGLDVDLICDSYGTHKTETVRKRLRAHPRFRLHFTPTGSSWLNLLERWFSELTNKKLAGVSTAPWRTWRPTSPDGSRTGTTIPRRSCATGPPTRSSRPSPATADASRTQGTGLDLA